MSLKIDLNKDKKVNMSLDDILTKFRNDVIERFRYSISIGSDLDSVMYPPCICETENAGDDEWCNSCADVYTYIFIELNSPLINGFKLIVKVEYDYDHIDFIFTIGNNKGKYINNNVYEVLRKSHHPRPKEYSFLINSMIDDFQLYLDRNIIMFKKFLHHPYKCIKCYQYTSKDSPICMSCDKYDFNHECMICMDKDKLDKFVKLNCCNKLIHENCLSETYATSGKQYKCPHCRGKVNHFHELETIYKDNSYEFDLKDVNL